MGKWTASVQCKNEINLYNWTKCIAVLKSISIPRNSLYKKLSKKALLAIKFKKIPLITFLHKRISLSTVKAIFMLDVETDSSGNLKILSNVKIFLPKISVVNDQYLIIEI